MEAIMKEIVNFIERDDLVYTYREEEEYGLKRSEAPSHIVKIKEASSPDGKLIRVVLTESYYDDAGVSYQEIVAELYASWIGSKRLLAYMSVGEDGMPSYSDQQLFNFINNIWHSLPTE